MTEKKQTQLYHVYVDTLKEAFKEGATPNEKDYGALIDLAAVGSKALGAKDATPTTPEPGEGLEIAQNKLAVKAGKGVIVDGNGVAVKGDGKSVRVTENGVGVQVKPDGGLTTDDGQGLHVKLGAGVTSTADGLAIHLADKSGLKADKAGLAVNVAAGLGIDGKGALEVKVKTGSDNYITSGTDGLAITPDGVKAIEAALKGVSIEALQKADAATSHGYKVDTTPAEPKEGVQKQIAEKLNEAFTEGWHLTQPRAALFMALKAFRTANTGKIYESGLIAPSAVTGKTGLYNQEGLEYGAGTVIAFKVNPAGEAREVKAGAYTEDGIYALVGKLDTDGVPKAGNPAEKVTPHALMVLVRQSGVTVVGHWDFNVGGWDGADSVGVWSPVATKDRLTELAAGVKGYWRGYGSGASPLTVKLAGVPATVVIPSDFEEHHYYVAMAPHRVTFPGRYSRHSKDMWWHFSCYLPLVVTRGDGKDFGLRLATAKLGSDSFRYVDADGITIGPSIMGVEIGNGQLVFRGRMQGGFQREERDVSCNLVLARDVELIFEAAQPSIYPGLKLKLYK